MYNDLYNFQVQQTENPYKYRRFSAIFSSGKFWEEPKMAIFGIGAYYGEDVSQAFIEANLVGVGHGLDDAPELHQFIRTLKVGDVVYIKSFSPGSSNIFIRGIGVIIDDKEAIDEEIVSCGRNVKWVDTQEFHIPKPSNEKLNVRLNTMYEEFHPEVQRMILERLYRE